jgi:hypothetical protein
MMKEGEKTNLGKNCILGLTIYIAGEINGTPEELDPCDLWEH